MTSRGAAHDPVPARRRFAGVDVGGTNVRVAVWEEGAERPTLVAASPLPPDLGALVELVAGALGGPVAGVGVGVPGRVVDGVAVWVPNARFLEGPGLAAELGARLAAPVALANDGHVALLGEARFGAARGLKDALLVTIGTGIGGAVMRSGRLVRGANGTAGSFGWLALGAPPVGGHDRPGAAGDPAGAATARGSAPPEVGPWEATASGQALERRAAALSRPVRARELSAAAAAGDVEAAAVLDRFVAEVGAGLASLASLFDPEALVVSGGVAELVAELMPRVRAVFEACASPSSRATPVRVAELGRAAGAFGAAVYAREGDEVYLP